MRLTRVAAALAIYRADHGAYPDRLEQLAPGIIDALPTDISDGTRFVYQRTNDGYLVYTKGSNHADENGSNENLETFNGYQLNDLSEGESQKLKPKIPAGADDISIRVPIPSFKLPEASQSALQQ